MDDLERDALSLRLKHSDTLSFPRILGHRPIKGPYLYTVYWLTGNGSWDKLRTTHVRKDALDLLARLDGSGYVAMFDALTEEKIAETGRATPQLYSLIANIRQEFLTKCQGKANDGAQFTRQNLRDQFVTIYRMIWLPEEGKPVHAPMRVTATFTSEAETA